MHVWGEAERNLSAYQTPEPQPWGAVTRRAVAQRRSRASGLTRLLAEAIRGFDSGFCCRPVPPRFAVSLLLSVLYL